MDSCYLCEIGTEGLIVPASWAPKGSILICADCALDAIYAHPKLAAFTEVTKGQPA